MKILFTLLAGLFLTVSASATNIHDDFKLGTNKETKKVEIRFESKSKKTIAAVLTVTDASGKVISTQNANLLCGSNAICLCDALDLSEGTYMVTMVAKKKTYSSQFIIWK